MSDFQDKVLIVDDFLDKDLFFQIKEEVIESESWTFNPGISVENEGDPKIFYGFAAGVVDEEEPENYLYEYGTHIPLIKRLNEEVKRKFNLTKVLRCRIDMTTFRGEDSITFAPHIDLDGLHMTSIFYLNDSDAPTIIYDQMKLYGDVEESIKDLSLTVKEKVYPKENRLVLFKGNHIHTGMCPTTSSYRILINTNYL